jgi:hypothetical protein
MVAQAAATLGSQTDVRARLQAGKLAEQRRRQQTWTKNIPGLQTAQAGMLALSMLGTAPQFDNEAAPESSPQTQTMPAGEQFQRAARSRQIKQQIGQSVGIDLNRRPNNQEELSPLEQIQQDYGRSEAELLAGNQLDLDDRSSFAKRGAQRALQETGLDKGIQALNDEFQKKMSAIIANSSGAIGEVVDSLCEDGGITEGVVFIQNQVQAARTILSPAPPEIGDITSVQDLTNKAGEAFLDALVPRFNLHTVEGIEGFLKAIVQWFMIALIIVVLSLLILIQMAIFYYVFQFINNPLATIFNAAASYFGF